MKYRVKEFCGKFQIQVLIKETERKGFFFQKKVVNEHWVWCGIDGQRAFFYNGQWLNAPILDYGSLEDALNHVRQLMEGVKYHYLETEKS